MSCFYSSSVKFSAFEAEFVFQGGSGRCFEASSGCQGGIRRAGTAAIWFGSSLWRQHQNGTKLQNMVHVSFSDCRIVFIIHVLLCFRSWIDSWTNSLTCALSCGSFLPTRPVRNPPPPGASPSSAVCSPWRPAHRGVAIITAPVTHIRGRGRTLTDPPIKPSGTQTTSRTSWTL